MINFPIFERLDIMKYGLFPGESQEAGLHVQFLPGLTLVLGANGLGKTTLVTILYRLLAGTFDIPGLSARADLGNMSLQPALLPPSGRRVFAQRVVDGAAQATAALSFRLGNRAIFVERRLSDLALARFTVDGQDLTTDEAGTFQLEIPKLVGVSSFGDWILLLRYLVFYFEDRRALVWDASAQRQVLRLLLLPVEIASKWAEAERSILELDSRARNLSAATYREERALVDTELRLENVGDVRAELQTLEALQQVDIGQRDRLDADLLELDARRQSARLRMLKAEQEREARYRNLERAKLTAVDTRFPKTSDSARYILAQLMADAECLVCGNHVPRAAASLERRIEAGRCVVCGSDLSHKTPLISRVTVADRRVQKSAADLAAIEPELTVSRQQLDEAEKAYSTLVDEMSQLNASISERSVRIDVMVRRLPPAEADIHRQRAELAGMRSRVETLRKEVTEKQQAFSRFVESESRALVKRSGDIQAAFTDYAEDFLIEKCYLAWSPQRVRVGQYGDPIEFPAFQLDMTGADFPSPVRRTGPEQVSESQREFIDLAFRMSLISVAGARGVGSLIIDAPESSLDAVFVARAANVLARFGAPGRGNRLIVTSNLIEGKLIPTLLGLASTAEDRPARVIDLFQVAEPTAALRQMRAEYKTVLKRMLASIRKDTTRGQGGGMPSAKRKRT